MKTRLFFALIVLASCRHETPFTNVVLPDPAKLKKVIRTTDNGNNMPHVSEIEYIYRPDGRLDSIWSPDRRYKAVYDDWKMSKMLVYTDSAMASFFYDYTYDSLNRPVRLGYWMFDAAAGTYEQLRDYSYIYNTLGQVTQEITYYYGSNRTYIRMNVWQNGNVVSSKHFNPEGELTQEYRYGYDTQKSPGRLSERILVVPGRLSKNNVIFWEVTDHTGLIDYTCYGYFIDYEYSANGYPLNAQSTCEWSEVYEYE